MQIRVQNNDLKIDFQLNESPAAKTLIEQLPLTLDVDNFGDNEKIFYPDKKLNVTDTKLADPQKGDLCYYSPWGDVVMYYKATSPAGGLYSLGKVINGKENIQKLKGSLTITKLD
ncbi:hypothetical protein GCM10022297_15590 [Lactobacillus hamsteri]|uniref:Cyclophilin-like domain-containing protein n=1 Tax=Lactobacillus hamsteri DSM 5661 = JCM 6256 TaxID=1423754 RepID=A0A0R1YDU7_9LACO|nr:cyclophilin-like fold protein [Lactobacillus hamsteri]KRM40728.1 hypothetical protein FC39_GL000212 [Lactobacillus hamsteri DSM 5661 = JCM 6256]